ncbi:hypothetical protein [Gordonibacter sp. 28C]|nr:hypothetical protein [Gordonibacter sp. 28C]
MPRMVAFMRMLSSSFMYVFAIVAVLNTSAMVTKKISPRMIMFLQP